MKNTLLSYQDRDSFVHSLTGATKLLCFAMWSVMGMLTFDTRVLGVMLIISIIIFSVSKIGIRAVSFVLVFMLVFLVMNDLALFLFAPYEGVKIYGSRHDLFRVWGNVFMTQEQLFYEFNVTLKYLCVVPIAIIFISTTDPSEFASSMNRIGINYKIGYAVALALRYIPDIQREYGDISVAQQARGIDISRKEKFGKRIKNAALILVPLIFSSFQRIETISNAMELRRFGEHKKRSWYKARPFAKRDYLVLVLFVGLLIASIVVTYYDGNRFYNPFR